MNPREPRVIRAGGGSTWWRHDQWKYVDCRLIINYGKKQAKLIVADKKQYLHYQMKRVKLIVAFI